MKANFIILAVAVAALSAAGTAKATVLDLGSSGSGFLGGAFFSTTDIQPTGTGVFDPFLTIQNTPVEPSSVIFGFLGLVVAVSSRRALAARVRVVASRNK